MPLDAGYAGQVHIHTLGMPFPGANIKLNKQFSAFGSPSYLGSTSHVCIFPSNLQVPYPHITLTAAK